jgi:signal peptidase I
MKKLLWIGLVALMVISLSGCSAIYSLTGSQNSTIQPGDKVGDFLVTTGVEGDFTYGFTVACMQTNDATTYSCQALVGDNINVSTGIYVSDKNANPDDILSHSKYQMFIDDRPVDLQAFGLIEYTHPGAEKMGTIYFANVVITTDKPGQITVKDEGVYDNGEPFTSTSTYVFSHP